MLNRIKVVIVGLTAVLTLSSSAFAQTAQPQQSEAAKPQKEPSAPAPRHDILWGLVPARRRPSA